MSVRASLVRAFTVAKDSLSMYGRASKAYSNWLALLVALGLAGWISVPQTWLANLDRTSRAAGAFALLAGLFFLRAYFLEGEAEQLRDKNVLVRDRQKTLQELERQRDYGAAELRFLASYPLSQMRPRWTHWAPSVRHTLSEKIAYPVGSEFYESKASHLPPLFQPVNPSEAHVVRQFAGQVAFLTDYLERRFPKD